MKEMISIVAVCMACVLSAAVPPRQGGGQPPPSGPIQPQAAGRQPPRPQAGQQGRRVPAGARGRRMQGRTLSESDQKLVDSIEEADSLSILMRLSRRAQASRSAEVRQAMVDALEDKGKDAANELAVYLADPDEDVAGSAFSAWSAMLEDMKPARRVLSIQAAAQILQSSRLQVGGQHGHAMPPSAMYPQQQPMPMGQGRR